MNVLGIESSCDDCSIAVVGKRPEDHFQCYCNANRYTPSLYGV